MTKSGPRKSRGVEPIFFKIGKRIRWSRIKAGMTQDELAMAIDGYLGRTSITNIEKGKQRLQVDQLHKISKILGIPIEHFFDNEKPQDLPTPPLFVKIHVGFFDDADNGEWSGTAADVEAALNKVFADADFWVEEMEKT